MVEQWREVVRWWTLIGGLLICVWAGQPGDSSARRLPLDPQNRVHAGLSVPSVNSLGVSAGMDSRMTRIIFVDVGGFLSPLTPPDPSPEDGVVGSEAFLLRHALYVAPGFRIPHRQPKAFAWDVITRGGFGAVWAVDTAHENDLQSDPALLGGLEFSLQRGNIGTRLSGKAFYFKPFSSINREEVFVLRPHGALEAVYQW